MVSMDTFRKLALSLPEVTEEPHFEKTSCRVKRKSLQHMGQTLANCRSFLEISSMYSLFKYEKCMLF
jgi:hypothetical protein